MVGQVMVAEARIIGVGVVTSMGVVLPTQYTP